MRILRNYILKEFFGFFLLSLGLFTFVMLMGNFIRMANLIINKGADLVGILKLFFYLIPYLLTYTIPISILNGLLLSLGRLSSDNEILAIRAVGLNIIYLIIPLLIIGLIFSLFLLILNDTFIPYSHFATRRVITEVGLKNPSVFLEPGVFIDAFQNYIIFIYHIQDNKLFNIRIYQPQPDNRPARTIIAKKGEFISIPEKAMIKLKLIDGTADEPDPDNPYNFYKLNFKAYFLNLNLGSGTSAQNEKKLKDMNFKELKQYIEKMKNMKIDYSPVVVHLNERIAISFSCIIFMLVGAAVALFTRRKEKSINLGLAFLIVGVYYLLLLLGESLSINKLINPIAGIWLPNFIFGGLGAFLLYRVCEA